MEETVSKEKSVSLKLVEKILEEIASKEKRCFP